MRYDIKAPAKINIGLDVIRKREDGYHDLKMIMQTIDIYDTLTFETGAGLHIDADEAEGTQKEKEIGFCKIEFTCSNPALSDPEGNLVVKAIRLLADEFDIRDHIKVHLDKKIPVAAGMAGGSSDAAAAFIAINDIYKLGLDKTELMKRAVKLGADIPYCIMRGTALCEGIGDIITPISPFPKDVSILVVKPPIEVSTGFVYGNLKIAPETVHPDIDRIIALIESYNTCEGNSDIAIFEIGSLLGNVLEDVTIPAYPIIKEIKETMMSFGACGALMSGSGPSVFALFYDEDNSTALAKADKAAQYFKKHMPDAFVSVAGACF